MIGTFTKQVGLCVTTNACLEHSRDKKACVFSTSVCQKHFLEELVSNPTHAYDFWHGPSTILGELHFIAAHAHLLQTQQNRLVKTRVHPEGAAPEVNQAAPIFTKIHPVYQMQRFQLYALTTNRNRCSRIDRVQDLQIDHCLPMVQSGHSQSTLSGWSCVRHHVITVRRKAS